MVRWLENSILFKIPCLPQQKYYLEFTEQFCFSRTAIYRHFIRMQMCSFNVSFTSYGRIFELLQEGMPFEFGYQVNDEYSGNDFSHRAESDGHVTEGEYRIALPDGRMQIVTYTADHEDGYKAEVKYEGEARYDEPEKSRDSSHEELSQVYTQPQQTYSQPQQTYSQPQQTYSQPQQSYNPPQQTYGQPSFFR